VKNRKEAPDVQMAAIIALGEMEDSTAGPVLMEALSNQEAWISGRILESLGETHYESAIPKLKEVLKDSTKSRDMRESAAEGLVAMGTPEAFSALLEGYEAEKENRNIRSDIQSAIGYLKSESLIPMLSDVLRDKSQSPELKSAITAALFRMGTPAALNGVTEAFFVEDPGFRRIVFNRSMYKDEEFKENREKLVPKVVNMIKDAGLPKPAKETAIQFLEKMRVNTPEGINALIGALDDNGREVRIQAAYALGNLRAESAIPALAKHLSDGAMNEAVEFALYKIGDPGVKTLIAARKKELEDKAIAQEQKINIMASLVKTEENDAIQSVIERQDPVLMTSNGLQKVFSGVQNQIAIRYLTSIATDPHQALHMPRYAGYALRESKNSVVVQQELTKKLRDPNPQVQTLAIETIEYLHLFEAIPKLHHVLKNPSSDKEVREKSALAVVNISRDSRENVPFSVVSDVAPVLQNVIVEGISENKDKSISISGQSVVDATRFFIDFKEEESVQKILNSPNLRQKLTQFKMYLTDLPTRGIPRDDKLLADLTSLLGQ
ncbi:MAG: HEAT repeat domain-containing protein, partial [Deltaproteobacteria bacterium]|nr:HEAT repeat domain-containing protein [Deltaproteobacteria bacterium]